MATSSSLFMFVLKKAYISNSARYAARYRRHSVLRMLGVRAPLPNVFIVGGKRCGTTLLKTLLAAQRDVWAPTDFEEVRFFDRYHVRHPQQYRNLYPAASHCRFFWDKRALGAVHYAMLYRQGGKGNIARYPIRLDKSVNYLFFPYCGRDISRLIPHAKIIFLLRHPTARAISDYYFTRRLFTAYDSPPVYPETRPPEQALCHEDKALEAMYQDVLQQKVMSPGIYHMLRIFSYHRRGLYAEQVKRYMAHFPAGQLLILRSEDLYQDTERVLARVLDFLQIEPTAKPAPALIANGRNATQYGEKPSPGVYDYLNDYYARPNAELYTLLGTTLW